MDLSTLEHLLERRLAEPLPGSESHLTMATRPRRGWQPGRIPPDCLDSAALLLLYPLDGRPHLVLTLRDEALPQHGGQVSLPGGRVEPTESFAEAALREAHEEIGVDPAATRLLGPLSPLHIPVSGFVLHPQIAATSARPDLRPQAGEVARILEVPVADLQDPHRIGIERRIYEGTHYEVPYFRVEDLKVWGATAIVLAEFLAVLGTPPSPWSR